MNLIQDWERNNMLKSYLDKAEIEFSLRLARWRM